VEFTITPSEDGPYIEVVAIGAADSDDIMELSRLQFAMGRELGIHRFLVDATRSPNANSIMGNIRFTMADVPTIPAPEPAARTAVLVDPADHSHDFYVAFAQSQGHDIALFWNREDALDFVRDTARRRMT